MDLPIVFNLDVAIAGTGMPYRWDDDYGARLGVLRRDDPFGEIRWFDIDPCYVFHVVNAYDAADGNSIELQAVRYPELWRHDGGFDADGCAVELDDRPGRRHRDRTSARRPRRRVPAHRRSAGRDCRPATRCRSPATGWCATTCATAAPSSTTSVRGTPGEAVFVPSASGTGRREQRLVPGLRLRPGPRRQRPGDPRRVGLRGQAGRDSITCRNGFRTVSTETGSTASRTRAAAKR